MSGGNLEGRAAIVTGSSRNIGKAIAIALADEGAAVVINARRSVAEAEAVAAEIAARGGRAFVAVADVSDLTAVEGMVDAAIRVFGRLDILVNNASVRREVDFAALDYAEWRSILSTTLDSAYLCCHAALPHLMASGQGAIVNIGGLSSHTGSARRAHVVAAKAGLLGLTRALAHDLAPHAITVNCVAPGLIDTVRVRPAAAAPAGEDGAARDQSAPQAAVEPAHHAQHAPLVGRRGRPEEVAALVCFLCGPRARYITGQTIHANGGAIVT
jgi:3-oxoacyl-[acyl-carrier protein] reductase